MLDSIEAVAFDIDGTIYPDLALYIRLVPYFLKNIKFFLHYSKVRKILHRTAPLADFYEYQGRLLAERMKISVAEAKTLIEEKVYKGLSHYFKKVKPFKYALETVQKIKQAGYKVGILSDFPPEQKGSIWGIAEYCDVILGSEQTGALKPSLYCFGILGIALDVPREKILYVGNSIRCDVKGAKNAGMKVAFKMNLFRSIFKKGHKDADFSFCSYKKLQEYVLGTSL